MRPVSSRFTETVTGSAHQLAVEVSLNGELLPCDGGSVTLDLTAATRGRADLSFSEPRLVPNTSEDALAPYDNELVIRRGLVYPDGDTELVQLLVGRIEETEVRDGPDGLSIGVSLLDRSQRVMDAKFEEPYEIAGGTDYLEAIENVVAGAMAVTTDFPERDLQTPALVAEEGEDRWAFAQSMAQAIGMDLYFDNSGVLVLRPVPELASDPVAYLVEGENELEVKPALLELTRRWSRTEAHNRWTVVGENPDTEGPPPRAVATDDNPLSPTYYYGSFGRKPADTYTSPFITTDEQAQDAANGMKQKELGTMQSVDFGAIVNPALEPGDVVHITRTRRDPSDLDTLVKIADERHIVDSLTFPLDATGTMSGTTRSVKVVS